MEAQQHSTDTSGVCRKCGEPWPQDKPCIPEGTRPFDLAIARINRSLSEFMIQAKLPQDPADTATLRHHAGDLILSGVAVLKRQGKLADLKEYLPSQWQPAFPTKAEGIMVAPGSAIPQPMPDEQKTDRQETQSETLPYDDLVDLLADLRYYLKRTEAEHLTEAGMSLRKSWRTLWDRMPAAMRGEIEAANAETVQELAARRAAK